MPKIGPQYTHKFVQWIEQKFETDVWYNETYPIEMLNNDHRNYQRSRIEENVIKHLETLKTWEPNDFRNAHKWVGIGFVREDGSTWIINGQHHVEASLRLGQLTLPFYIFNSGNWPEFPFEIILFNLFQDYQNDKLDFN